MVIHHFVDKIHRYDGTLRHLCTVFHALGVEPGWVFVCISGTAVDGHQFAEQAKKAGAAAIVCERDLGLDDQLLGPSTRAAWSYGNPDDPVSDS